MNALAIYPQQVELRTMPPKSQAKSERNNFDQQTVKAIAQRSGYKCANCHALTCGPTETDSKSINIGEAAHITAAAPGGPRYHPDMSPETRSSESNGIWLCRNCHKIVDTDVNKYTVERLQELKKEAEADAGKSLGMAAIGKPGPYDNSPIGVTTSSNAVMAENPKVLEDVRQAKSQTHPNG